MDGRRTQDAGRRTLIELVRSRRTIHIFKPEPPPEHLILDAIESARWAPNHRVTEPWHFYIMGPETSAKIAELNSELVFAEKGERAAELKLQRWLGMPAWLVVTCNRSGDEIRQREDYAACCCAVQNLFLHLWSEGIGAKWGTGPVTRHTRFYDLICADPDVEMVWLSGRSAGGKQNADCGGDHEDVALRYEVRGAGFEGLPPRSRTRSRVRAGRPNRCAMCGMSAATFHFPLSLFDSTQSRYST